MVAINTTDFNSIKPMEAANLQGRVAVATGAAAENADAIDIIAADQLSSLSGYLERCWQAAKNSRQLVTTTSDLSLDQRLLDCARRRKGVYSPSKLVDIRNYGGSEIYMMLTSMKCRGLEAWMKNVLLRPGEKPWSVSPTTIPDLPDKVENILAKAVVASVTESMIAAGDPDAVSLDQVDSLIEEVRAELLDASSAHAKKQAEQIERYIEDQLLEGNYYESLVEFITDFVTYPTAYLKGPISIRKPVLEWGKDAEGNPKPKVTEEAIRSYYSPRPFDMYPGPTSKRMNDGYIFERHALRRSELYGLIGLPGYKEDAIRSALIEYGAGGLREWLSIDQERSSIEGRSDDQQSNDPERPIEATEFWGKVQGKLLLDWGMSNSKITDSEKDYHITAWKVGAYVIMARLNPHPTGKGPYYSASYERINDSIWGISPPELMSDNQDVCNACARSIVNNMAIASGPQVEMMMDRLAPGENAEHFWPWKIWKTMTGPDANGKGAMQFFQPDSNAAELLQIYQYFFDQSSEVVGAPGYMYGNAEVGGAGETASGLSMLLNAASKVLQEVIAHVDKSIIKPSIADHWLHVMLFDEDFPVSGDINVVARASENLIIQEQLAVRRQEFLNATVNDMDFGIMGVNGRAAVLRENVKALKMPHEEIIPSKKKMQMKQEQEEKIAAMLAAEGEGGAAGPGSNSPVGQRTQPTKPAAVDAAGNRQGGAR